MSDLTSKYKNSINEMCLNDISLSADDILKAYDSRNINASENSKVIPDNFETKTNKRAKVTMLKHAGRALGAAAATVFLTGVVGVTAGAMGYGPLATLFEEKVSDPTSAAIVEEGYLFEVGTTQHTKNFDFTLEGITGNTYSPVMLFTIRTDSEDFATTYDSFNFTLYNGLGIDEYENHRIDLGYENIEGSVYWYETVTAVQDEEDPYLYYAECAGLSTWILNGNKFVVALRSIQLGVPDTADFSEIMIEGKWILSCPEDNSSFKESNFIDFYSYDLSGRTFVNEHGITYFLRFVDCNDYRTAVNFGYNYIGTDFANGEEDFDKLWEDLDNEFYALLDNMTLVVDGEEYSSVQAGSTWCDAKGEIGPENQCYIEAEYPSISFEASTHISLIYNGTEIVIK